MAVCFGFIEGPHARKAIMSKVAGPVDGCSDPMKLDTFGADFSEHQEVVHAHAAIVPRTRPE
jgi:hypothetical protein